MRERPAIAPWPPYAGPFALLGQLVNELHYDLVVRLLLPIRVRRVVLEFDADDVVANADEFRIVEEDGNDGAAYDARHENLSFERRPNLVGVVLVQDADDVAALLAEYLLELSRPRLPEIVRFEMGIVEDWHIEAGQLVIEIRGKLPVLSCKRESNVPLVIDRGLSEAAVLAELIPIEMLDEVEEGRVFDSERLRFGVVVKPLRDCGFRTDEHLKTVLLDVVDAPAHIRQGVRHFIEIHDGRLLLPHRMEELEVRIVTPSEAPSSTKFFYRWIVVRVEL